MRPQSQDVDSPSPIELRDKALNLRESVNSSRARMSAQAERLEKLRREIAALRALVDKPLPAPSPAVLPPSAPVRPNPPLRSAPLVKEAAPVSAAATASFKTDARDNSWRPVPYIAIFFVAVGIQLHVSRIKAPAPIDAVAVAIAPAVAVAASPEPILDDGGADEALLLAHDWRLPGDERPLAERLGSDTNPPGSQPEWTAERTGERTYRVSFKPSRADPGYDFDVDLTARSVDPTPETAALISPRLASRR
jgi:hypothetical protein